MKLTPEVKADRALRRRFERDTRNYNLDYRRLPTNPEQYAEYPTELAFTFYQLGARK